MADQQPIDDALLGRFLAGQTNPAESARVRQWLISQNAGVQDPTHDDLATFERIWAVAQADQPPIHSLDNVAGDRRGQNPLSDPAGSSWRWVWVAAVLVLLGSLGWLAYRMRFMSQHYAAEHVMTLVAADQTIRKTLPDGSKILLNRHSTLRYPTAFTGNTRDVTLRGEAFFDVVPQAEHPFRVSAQSTVVQGPGMSFSVRAYDASVNVAVRTGRVRFASPRQVVRLMPNQQATFDATADTLGRAVFVTLDRFGFLSK